MASEPQNKMWLTLMLLQERSYLKSYPSYVIPRYLNVCPSIKPSILFNTDKTIPTSLSSTYMVSQSTHGFKGLLGPVAGLEYVMVPTLVTRGGVIRSKGWSSFGQLADGGFQTGLYQAIYCGHWWICHW